MQALGRCTRGLNDYSAVVVTEQDLPAYLIASLLYAPDAQVWRYSDCQTFCDYSSLLLPSSLDALAMAMPEPQATAWGWLRHSQTGEFS